MPLFCSEQELIGLGDDVLEVARRADEYIHSLLLQVETQKALADAAAINAEQTCSLIEQKFMSVTSENAQLETDKSQLIANMENREAEIAVAKSQVQQLQLTLIKLEAELERARVDAVELSRGRRELQSIIERKNFELDEKNVSIKRYLDKIVEITEERSQLEAKRRDDEAEVIRSRSTHARLSQEKGLLENHNAWLKEELVSKTDALHQDRAASADVEAELRCKLLETEKGRKEAMELAGRAEERVKEHVAELERTRQELKEVQEESILQGEQLSTEVATVARLAELYKETAEEATQKSSELEGVIKALEVHLKRQEDDAAAKLQKECEAHNVTIKQAKETEEQLKEKLMRAQEEAASVESGYDVQEDFGLTRKIQLPLEPDLKAVLHGSAPSPPTLPPGSSSTAIGSALIRDGWSLTKMYSRYEEAADAWRHERQERVEVQRCLDIVAEKVQAKMLIVEEEREEHMRMVDAYTRMEAKLRAAALEKARADNIVMEVKADLRSRSVEVRVLENEIKNLNDQLSVFLMDRHREEDRRQASPGGFRLALMEGTLNIRSFSDLVEANSDLRTRLQMLQDQLEQKETELQATFQAEIDRHDDERMQAMGRLGEEIDKQKELMAAQKRTLDLYKRLYEEELQHRISPSLPQLAVSGEIGDENYKALMETKEKDWQKFREENAAFIKDLQSDLNKARDESSNARVDRARAEAEAKYLKERSESIAKDLETQRQAMEGVLRRNMDFSQTIVEYQRRIRESAQVALAAEENARQLSIQASVLEKEKELLSSAEEKVSKEVKTLTERVHYLQVTLETVQQAEDSKEGAHILERKRFEDDINRLQREWTEAKKELEAERLHTRNLVESRDRAVTEVVTKLEIAKNASEDVRNELHAADTRAQVLQARCDELQLNLKKYENSVASSFDEAILGRKDNESKKEADLETVAAESRRAAERAQEDLTAIKGHLEQYKSIAQSNEEAARQIHAEYEKHRQTAEENAKAADAREEDLRRRLADLETEMAETIAAAGDSAREKDTMLTQMGDKIQAIHHKESALRNELEIEKERVSTLLLDVESSQKKWREAQTNYERQVMLQGDTIRELTKASARLSDVESQVASAISQAVTAEAALSREEVAWEARLESMRASKDTAEKRAEDLESQNRLLLDRLEAAHITSAKEVLNCEGSQPIADRAKASDGNFQDVLRYLRRAKETSDVEVQALKRERMRLQRQIEVANQEALQAREEMRALQEKTRESMCSQEEYKALKSQIDQITLLRESNAMLREEGKSSMEDAQQWRERARKAESEVGPLQAALRMKEAELEVGRKVVEVAKSDADRWQHRVKQLLDRYKTVDLEAYERVQSELFKTEENLNTLKEELDKVKVELCEASKRAHELEVENSKKESRIADLEKELQEGKALVGEALANLEKEQQAHASMKTSRDKINSAGLKFKKMYESTTKEKERLIEEWNRERESLHKQVEAAKASATELGKNLDEERKKSEAAVRLQAGGQHAAGQARRDAETEKKTWQQRAQTLQKAVLAEKERRQKEVKALQDVLQRAHESRVRVMDELSKHREWMDKHKACGLPQQASEVMASAEEANARYEVLVDEIGGQLEVLASAGEIEPNVVLGEPLKEQVPTLLPATRPPLLPAPSLRPIPGTEGNHSILRRSSTPSVSHVVVAESLEVQRKLLLERIAKAEAEKQAKKAAEDKEKQRVVRSESPQAVVSVTEEVSVSAKLEEKVVEDEAQRAEKMDVLPNEGQKEKAADTGQLSIMSDGLNKAMGGEMETQSMGIGDGGKEKVLEEMEVVEPAAETMQTPTQMDVQESPAKELNSAEASSHAQDEQRQGLKRKAAADIEVLRESRTSATDKEQEEQLAVMRARVMATIKAKEQKAGSIKQASEMKEGTDTGVEVAKSTGSKIELQEAPKELGIHETDHDQGPLAKAPRQRRLIRPKMEPSIAEANSERKVEAIEKASLASITDQGTPPESVGEKGEMSDTFADSGGAMAPQVIGSLELPSIQISPVVMTDLVEATGIQTLSETGDADNLEEHEGLDTRGLLRGKRSRTPDPGQLTEGDAAGNVSFGAKNLDELVQNEEGRGTEVVDKEQNGLATSKRPRIVRQSLQKEAPVEEEPQPALSLTLIEDEGGPSGTDADGIEDITEGVIEENRSGVLVSVTTGAPIVGGSVSGQSGFVKISEGNSSEVQPADLRSLETSMVEEENTDQKNIPAGTQTVIVDSEYVASVEGNVLGTEEEDGANERESKEADNSIFEGLQDDILEDADMLDLPEDGEIKDVGALELVMPEDKDTEKNLEAVGQDISGRSANSAPAIRDVANEPSGARRLTRLSRASQSAAAAPTDSTLRASAGTEGGPAAAAGVRTRSESSLFKRLQEGVIKGEGSVHGSEVGTGPEAADTGSGKGRIVSISEQANDTPALREQRRVQRFAERPASLRVRGRGKTGGRVASAGARGSGRLVSLSGRGKGGQAQASVPSEEEHGAVEDTAVTANPSATPEENP